jgi:hypothetical protein
VEEVGDEEADGCHRWVQEFDGAAEELGEGKTLFEEIHERQEAMCESPMALFADEDEWELARWLMKNVTQTATEEFLKMKGVCHSLAQIRIFSPTHWSDPVGLISQPRAWHKRATRLGCNRTPNSQSSAKSRAHQARVVSNFS